MIAALSVGQYMAAAEAMFIVLVGEGLESYAAGRTEPRRSAASSSRCHGGRVCCVTVERRKLTRRPCARRFDRRPGWRAIPADGFIEAGTSEVNESSITGEPLPREKTQGDEIFSGTLNGNGLLRIRVTRAGDDTTLARVARLVSDANTGERPVERLADR